AFQTFMPDGVAPDALGTLAVDGAFELDAGADTVTFTPLRAEAFGLAGNVELTGRSVSSAARWSGRAEIAPFSPRELLRRLGQPEPQSSDPTALGRATIATRFAVDVAGEQAR